MSEMASDGTHQLLEQAAALAGPMTGVGDVAKYLRAYYRHVPPDELAGAGPERVAGVAAASAEFAAHRPQGRALVRIRAGGDATLDATSDVIDIVTDDMPFLVDSISMELGHHGLSARLVLHPQLRVRRDVGGALHEVIGQHNGGPLSHDELAESWTHIEVGALAAGEAEAVTADLQRVLGDVRVAVEDFTRMRSGPRRRRRRRPQRDRRAAALAGRRALHVPRLPRVRPGDRGRRPARAARRARHRPRHPAP
jgi:glutamate dehydrogenase